MLDVMTDMSRVLCKRGLHWQITYGNQLSVVRDGIIQLFDHNFDPLFEAGMGKTTQMNESRGKEMYGIRSRERVIKRYRAC